MKGRKGPSGRPGVNSLRDGRVSPSRRVPDAGVVPAKQQLGFEVPGTSSLPREADKSDATRLLFASCVSVGSQAEILLKSGESVEGTFISAKPGPEGGYVLGDVKPIANKEANGPVAQQAFRGKTVYPASEVASLTVKDVDLSGSADPMTDGPTSASKIHTARAEGFNTDNEISRAGRQGLVNRELVPWVPDDDGLALEDLTLTSQAKKGGHWDQFAANKAQFGVQTSFDEDIYTTKLDRSKAKISEKEAARIAREIEGKKTNNPHEAEERGQIQYREMDADEEARYSAVSRGAGKDLGSHEFDSKNDDTFESGSSMQGSKPWSGAANSVAAITGRASSTGGRSAPIDMDPRKEHNKVRMQLAGNREANKDRSPYGTPKGGRSPLFSPLVGNAAQVEALDLNVDSGIKYDPGVRSEFRKFKQAFKQGSLSPSNDSELAKQASVSVDSPPEESSTPPRNPPEDSPPGPRQEETEQGDIISAQQNAAQAQVLNQRKPLMSFAPSSNKGMPEQVRRKLLPEDTPNFNFGSIAPPAGPSGLTGASQPMHAPQIKPLQAPGHKPGMQGLAGEARPSTAPASKLNPKAKEFKFNPTAVSFMPATLSRAPSGASSAATNPSNPAAPSASASTELSLPRSIAPVTTTSKQPGMSRPGSTGPGRMPVSGVRPPSGMAGRASGRTAREAASVRHPGSPKPPSRFDRQGLQSARSHPMSGSMHRPLMSGEGPMTPHSHMMQQQQQMMANGGMMPSNQMHHLAPPGVVPPYEMGPPRAPFPHNPAYMVPGSPMYASPPYQQGPHPMMVSPPHNQPSGMYQQPGYPMGMMYPGHAMGMMVPHPHYEGGNGH